MAILHLVKDLWLVQLVHNGQVITNTFSPYNDACTANGSDDFISGDIMDDDRAELFISL